MMIPRSLLSAGLACALVLVLPLAAQESEAEKYTPLEEQMEEMNVSYRRLGRQVADPAKNADSARHAAKLREVAAAARDLEPKKLAELPEADRPSFLKAYRERMDAFIAEAEKLEAALKADRNDEAKEIYARLRQAQEDGHRDFRPKRLTFEEKAAEAARRTEEFNAQQK